VNFDLGVSEVCPHFLLVSLQGKSSPSKSNHTEKSI